jgi:hypothetical protein
LEVVKLVRSNPGWLAYLIILVLASLVITGCPEAEPPPAEQPTPYKLPVNQPPVIDSLTSQWRQVKKAMSVPIECTAIDPDGDTLSYSWSVDGGDISGDGAVGDWSTPDANGTYTITVTVTDGRGGQATKSLEIKVACCLREADE